MTAEVDLERFRRAQDRPGSGFATALAEIRAGEKRGHWIWYVFPQLEGLGRSTASHTYAIRDVHEAESYLRDPVLGPRLLSITQAVAERLGRGDSVDTLMGSSVDVLKLVSSLTLFGAVAARLAPIEPDPRMAALAGAADAVLQSAEDQGYPRCRFTLARLPPAP
jgi:uncharacterized protein (DUF1810 family)